MERKTASTVPGDRAGSTIADYLTARFTYLGAKEWLDQIAHGRVTLKGEATGPDTILAMGDCVAFDPSAIEEPTVDSSFIIIMEDDDFLVVDKSGSLPCHPSGRFFRHSLWFILKERHGFIHIATRLDRETSGLVLVCKSPGAARLAQEMQASGSLRKTYLAMVHGRFPDRLETQGFLIKDENSVVRKKRRYVESLDPIGEKESETCQTSFDCAGRSFSPAGDMSLVRAHPRTGRTHQIRATLLSLGFPVVGDKLYGLDEGFFLRFADDRLDKDDLQRLILPNQALHCAELAFTAMDGRAVAAHAEPRWVFPDQLPCLT